MLLQKKKKNNNNNNNNNKDTCELQWAVSQGSEQLDGRVSDAQRVAKFDCTNRGDSVWFLPQIDNTTVSMWSTTYTFLTQTAVNECAQASINDPENTDPCGGEACALSSADTGFFFFFVPLR